MINISAVFAGQRLGIKEVDEGIWLVTFIDYDLGYVDLEQKACSPSTTPRSEVVTYVLGTVRHPCLQVGQRYFWRARQDETVNTYVLEIAL